MTKVVRPLEVVRRLPINMNAQIKELLKPEILNSINGMELIARIIVEGFMSGSNKSQTIGAGQEFSQYRNYEPGDDLRQLDWKMYARSERYYIKQAEIETNIIRKVHARCEQLDVLFRTQAEQTAIR